MIWKVIRWILRLLSWPWPQRNKERMCSRPQNVWLQLWERIVAGADQRAAEDWTLYRRYGHKLHHSRTTGSGLTPELSGGAAVRLDDVLGRI